MKRANSISVGARKRGHIAESAARTRAAEAFAKCMSPDAREGWQNAAQHRSLAELVFTLATLFAAAIADMNTVLNSLAPEVRADALAALAANTKAE